MAPFCGALLSLFSVACEMPLAGKRKEQLDFNRKTSVVANVFFFLKQRENVLVVIWFDCCGGVTFKTWLVFITTAIHCCKLCLLPLFILSACVLKVVIKNQGIMLQSILLFNEVIKSM